MAGPVRTSTETALRPFTIGPASAQNSSRDLAAALRDQPRGALVAGVDPEPAQRDAEPVAQADQEVDVGDAPDPPGEVPRSLIQPKSITALRLPICARLPACL